MAWNIRITNEAKKDYEKIEGSIRKQVLAGIVKVSKAPLPSPNGYGKPLGNKGGNDLTGFFKIKYRGIGIRVVYTLVVDKMSMNIIVISQRDDNYCYDMAGKLYENYGDEMFQETEEEGWVFVKGKDGSKGYIHLADGRITGLDKELGEVFSNVNFSD